MRLYPVHKSNSFITFAVISILICSSNDLTGQLTTSQVTGADLNCIQTSVPFLTIAPDGRSTGMGDVGAASTPDVNSQHWNAAKYAFVEDKGEVALTYSPWLTNLVPDIHHLYLAGYHRINDKNTISGSLRYFSLGTVVFGPGGTIPAGDYHPKEFATDAGYSRRFTDRFSGGVVLRYIHSDLTGGRVSPGGDITKPATSFAGDLGLYYQDNIQVGVRNAQWALGLNISNVGPPISYTDDAEKTPIPTSLRLGGRFSYDFNSNHTLSLHADLNKLLVPSPGVYNQDTATGDLILIRGKVAPESVIMGMFQSFYDAPGWRQPDGSYSIATEEFHEVTFGLGAEYWYIKQFAFRTGYFHEHATKGNRTYFTFGMGARYSFLTFDLSCLLPVNGRNSPLFNTFRFALTADLGRATSL